MEGTVVRFDCEGCRTVWFRQSGSSTACPECGGEMQPVTGPLVAMEVERGPQDAAPPGDRA